jgi:site-specific recombinase XerD
MLDELQRRNYSQSTTRSYIHAVEDFSKYFHRSPERLGPSHIREYQVHLFRDRKLSAGTIQSRSAALRFLFVKTLRRPYLFDEIPFPKRPRKLPTVLSPEEVARLIDSARNLMHRTMLMTLYATGVRRAELCHLKVTDIDSERMVIHVHQGKGSRDRDVLLTAKLLDTLREYRRWMKPKTYLFPGMVNNWRADVPITEKIVWDAVAHAAKQAGIKKHVSPIRSGTVSPLTCWKQAPICAPSRCFSDIPSSLTPLSTCTCPGVICRRFPARWKRSKCPGPTK